MESVAPAVNTCRRQHEKFSTSIQRRKRSKRTEYLVRLTYYDKTGKRKGVSKSAATHWDAKSELQDLIDQHVAGGSEVLEARNMTFAALAEHCKETRYCEAFYDQQGRLLPRFLDVSLSMFEFKGWLSGVSNVLPVELNPESRDR